VIFISKNTTQSGGESSRRPRLKRNGAMQQAMPTEFEQYVETIEDCYEFTLSYAAKGYASDEGNDAGRQLREKLADSAKAMRGVAVAFAETLEDRQLAPAEKYEAFFAVLARDAQCAMAAIEMVLAQPAISSQLIDNLNASIHLRALLTDLFLVSEIFAARHARANTAAAQ